MVYSVFFYFLVVSPKDFVFFFFFLGVLFFFGGGVLGFSKVFDEFIGFCEGFIASTSFFGCLWIFLRFFLRFSRGFHGQLNLLVAPSLQPAVFGSYSQTTS